MLQIYQPSSPARQPATRAVQENVLVQLLQSLTNGDTEEVLHGVGDDAAVIRGGDQDWVVTTDLIADGSHFLSHDATPEQIGRKAMAVNLSDIAAMAAKPVAAFVSLLLPTSTTDEYAASLMKSIIAIGREFDCPVAGGDTNTWDGKLAINVLILGKTTSRGPILRSNAKPGDWLLVTGELGGSLAGHHLNFRPRVDEALMLNERYELSAGMDLSDGLAMDVRRLSAMSNCGAEIFLDELPISSVLKQQTNSREEQIASAIGDGEDFELLLAVAPPEAQRILKDQPLDTPITRVGTCIAESSIWQIENGKRTPLPAAGYEHGSK